MGLLPLVMGRQAWKSNTLLHAKHVLQPIELCLQLYQSVYSFFHISKFFFTVNMFIFVTVEPYGDYFFIICIQFCIKILETITTFLFLFYLIIFLFVLFCEHTQQCSEANSDLMSEFIPSDAGGPYSIKD